MKPTVVVGLPERLGNQHFGVLLIAPLTTDRGQEWAGRSLTLYTPFPGGTASLKAPSICLPDQGRAVDAGGVRRYPWEPL